MIRVYLDWSVISNLKIDGNPLKATIDKYKEHLLVPYSPAHFRDLMKSYSPTNEKFFQDIEMLEYLSIKHYMQWNDATGTGFYFRTPKEHFEEEKEFLDTNTPFDLNGVFTNIDEMSENLEGSRIKNLIGIILQHGLSNLPEEDKNRKIIKVLFPSINSNPTTESLFQDYASFLTKMNSDGAFLKEFMKSIGDEGFKVEERAGQWTYEEVIDNIDKFLKAQGMNITFMDYVKSSFTQNNTMTEFSFFTQAYFLLGVLGYKQDKLPKPTDNMINITTDAEHAFYGAYCDYFVVIDKNLRIKSKALYHKLNISTQVISPEEFIQIIETVVDAPLNNEQDLIQDAINMVEAGTLVEEHFKSNDNNLETDMFVLKLPSFYLNFFNYVIYQKYEEEGFIILTFKRVFKNLSRFVYHTEIEKIVRECSRLFSTKQENVENDIKEFKENALKEVQWENRYGRVLLVNDSELSRPNLLLIIKVGPEENNKEES